MIKSITITNHLNDSLILELGSPEKSGFLIRSITGLGPVKADINVVELSTTDGAHFNSARLPSRNIVMDLVFLANPTIEDTRIKSYKYFPIKKQVKVKIETDSRISEIVGFVEDNSPDIFSIQSSAQVSIICPDPYFYSVADATTTALSGIEPMFEFPFESAGMVVEEIPYGQSSLLGLTENSTIVFGEIMTSHESVITYDGDADVGMLIKINAVGSATNLTIYNNETNESMKIDTAKLATLTGNTIIADDEITISTVKGNKYVVLKRNGVTRNILNALDKNSDWLQIRTGINVFAYIADYGAENLHITIFNNKLYEGV